MVFHDDEKTREGEVCLSNYSHTSVVIPQRKQYAKVCTKCEKVFSCDGVCGKEEGYKLAPTACFCRQCYEKAFDGTSDADICPSRFGSDAHQCYLDYYNNDGKEKVVFI